METSVVKRFLRYIAVDTQSAAERDVIPSTAKQFDLAKILVEELKKMGAQDVKMDDHAYVYATVPATSEKEIPVLGLIAHMDTSPACSGKNVNPQFINNYDRTVFHGEQRNQCFLHVFVFYCQFGCIYDCRVTESSVLIFQCCATNLYSVCISFFDGSACCIDYQVFISCFFQSCNSVIDFIQICTAYT